MRHGCQDYESYSYRNLYPGGTPWLLGQSCSCRTVGFSSHGAMPWLIIIIPTLQNFSSRRLLRKSEGDLPKDRFEDSQHLRRDSTSCTVRPGLINPPHLYEQDIYLQNSYKGQKVICNK
ncbi:hypothetical protein Y1Q_0003175 [Alligator mississippiensis]|uniref:Uncharacterized protein n=1 Tax=Alligator mississippiensis TaxID=8496 RepID=A0A151ME37_ALLMI|nr:hypothetical protein Y1Q_0003175 [Alligator mississippiensis]